MQIAA